MRDVRAAVLREARGAFRIERVRLSAPRPDEVVVRIVATGVCHADILVRDQRMGPPPPVVLGHEGAGVVVERGTDVGELEVGDHVVLSFAFCGACNRCLSGEQAYCDHMFSMNWLAADRCGHKTLHDCDGEPLGDHFFGQSSFATYAIVNQRNAIRVPKDVPLDLLGPLGCGIQTGAGAVLNSLRVTAGSRFLCLGAGAVGLSALLAARISDAAQIIMVDTVRSRLDLAIELGATHALDGRMPDIAATVADLTGGGADFVLDTTGVPDVISMGIGALAPRGTAGLVAGVSGAKATFDIVQLFAGGRTIKGIVEGDSIARIFIPQLVALHRAGRFPFDKFVKFYEFDEIDEAVHDSVAGTTVKPILRIGKTT